MVNINLNKKMLKLIILKQYYLIVSVIFLVLSCSKESAVIEQSPIDIPEGYAAIKVEMADIQFQEDNLNGAKKANVKISNNQNSFKPTRTDNESPFSCTVSLEPESAPSRALNSSLTNGEKSAVIRIAPIDRGIRYRLYVYNKNTGKLEISKSYIRGNESEQGPLLVKGGMSYIIVAYSINSKTEYPAEMDGAADINTATIANGQVEFMFQKQEIAIPSNSENTIKLRFKHQFAQINTIIKLDNITRTYASIKGVGGAAYFKPSYSKTTFKVSDSSVTADNADLNPLGASTNFPFIPFPNNNTYEIENIEPTILNTPSSIADSPNREGKFTIEALSIGEISRRVDIDNLNLSPGVKYNLVLTFNVPQTEMIGENPKFHFYDTSTPEGSLYSHIVELENPTFGAQIDVFYLDNSFNLNINGQDLFSRELNFEGFPYHDVYFSDGTYYGDAYYNAPSGEIDVIYWINDNAPRIETPVVRLTIDEFGNVQLFGRKNMSENLRELVISNNSDPITINPNAKLIPNGKNILTFTSRRWSVTDIQGQIYGIRRQ